MALIPDLLLQQLNFLLCGLVKMFQSLFGLLGKTLFDFGCLAYFISKSDRAYIQIRMPTLTMIIVVLGELLNILDTFLHHQESQTSISCAVYGITYSYLSIALIVIYTIMVCKWYNLANLKQNEHSERLKLVCSYISGVRKDVHFWDNPNLLKRFKRTTLVVFLCFMLIPGSVSFIIYGLIIGPSLTNGHGLLECRPWANSFALVFMIGMILFNVLLVRNIDFSNDIFKLRYTLYCTFIVFGIYGTMFGISIYFDVISVNGFSRIYQNIINSLSILTLTILPLYLSTKTVKNDLTIYNILKNKHLWNRFTTICAASLCSQYANYIEDFRKLDQSKPLLVQKFIKKFFNPDSPYFLNFQTWKYDLSNPDHYTFVCIERDVLHYLQTNFVVYMDSHSLDMMHLDQVKIDVQTANR